MIESSPYLRKIQMNNLCNLNQEPELEKEYESKYSNRIKITWLTDISQLPHKEAVHFFAANEFFDALPVHKFQVKLTHRNRFMFFLVFFRKQLKDTEKF